MVKKDLWLKVGDKVKATGNYHDEQLGEYAYTGIQTVSKVLEIEVTRTAQSGQWVKTDKEKGWIDCAWFRRVKTKVCSECGHESEI